MKERGCKSLNDVVNAITKQNKSIIRELMDQGATHDQASELTVFGEKTFKSEFTNAGAGLGTGLVFGIAGAIGNHYIAKHFKDEKAEKIKEVLDLRIESSDKDSGNGIGIIANKA